jgi:hypothetical protein
VSSNLKSELYLKSINFLTEATRVQYEFMTEGGEHCYTAELSDIRGIRSVVMPEELEEFLRPFCSIQPDLVKKLVAETWRLASQDQTFIPLRLA